jgi:hypothetical protein
MQGAAASTQSPSQLIKATDGKMRIDLPNTSVITDPKAQQAILLDHLKKTATILPMQPSMPQIPGMPGMQAPSFKPPTPPSVSVQDLGKSLIEGHEVDGKRYMVQPPTPPQLPGAPQIPGAPAPPQLPTPPQAPTIAEVWSSTKLGTPVLTKISGPFGQSMTYCKPQQIGEPAPSNFQIPPGYTPVLPKPPAPPSLPAPPGLPK